MRLVRIFQLIICSTIFCHISIAKPTLSRQPQRPRIPAQLDRATLQKLLDTIEQPNIASSLKIGYFGGRANDQSLPVAEGFSLLQAALKKEPVASKR